MVDSTTITVNKELKQRLDELKPSELTWNEFVKKLATIAEQSDMDTSSPSESVAQAPNKQESSPTEQKEHHQDGKSVPSEEAREQLEDIEDELEALQDQIITIPTRTADEVENRFSQY